MTNEEVRKLIEKLAAFEHKRWIEWSVALTQINELSRHTLERWKKLWIPYDQLEEDHKEKNRRWAYVILDVLKEEGLIGMSGKHAIKFTLDAVLDADPAEYEPGTTYEDMVRHELLLKSNISVEKIEDVRLAPFPFIPAPRPG
jgi:hypothetical protein